MLSSLYKNSAYLLLTLVILYQISIITSMDFEEVLDDSPVGGKEDDGGAASEEKESTKQIKAAIEKAKKFKSFGGVARDALMGAWDQFFKNRTDDIPVLPLLKGVNNIFGEERLATLRIMELMDADMNGKISKDEFVGLYAHAISTPDAALQLMFRVYDFDSDGYVSVYEVLNKHLTLRGINGHIFDEYSTAHHMLSATDIDKDGSMNLHEYILDIVVELSIGMARNGSLSWSATKK